jgi:hypothetical protein
MLILLILLLLLLLVLLLLGAEFFFQTLGVERRISDWVLVCLGMLPPVLAAP